MGFDIIVAEGQSLGSPLSFGGPTVGWFATKKEFARLVPGRLIGESRDKDNNKSYVMTLRAREQDIRREKASSNICTNQTLNAIGSAIHLSWLGPEGLYDMGYHSIQKANYMKKSLIKNGYVIPNDEYSNLASSINQSVGGNRVKTVIQPVIQNQITQVPTPVPIAQPVGGNVTRMKRSELPNNIAKLIQ